MRWFYVFLSLVSFWWCWLGFQPSPIPWPGFVLGSKASGNVAPITATFRRTLPTPPTGPAHYPAPPAPPAPRARAHPACRVFKRSDDQWHFCKNSLYSFSEIIHLISDISARLAKPFGGSFKGASWYIKAFQLRSVFQWRLLKLNSKSTSKNWGKEQNWITGFKSRNGRPKSCHTPRSRSILHLGNQKLLAWIDRCFFFTFLRPVWFPIKP